MSKISVFAGAFLLGLLLCSQPAAAFVDAACESLSLSKDLPVEKRLEALEACISAQSGFLTRMENDTKANGNSIGELYANLNAAVTASKAKNPDIYYRDNIEALKREIEHKSLEIAQLRSETEHVKAMFSYLFLVLDAQALDQFVELWENRSNKDHKISKEMQRRVELLTEMAKTSP